LGLDVHCTGRFRGLFGEGRLKLETDLLMFRGAFRFDALLRGLKVRASRGDLVVGVPGGEARFQLGEAAAKWVERIKHPKGLIEKLGVLPTQDVAVIDVTDAAFRSSLREKAATVVVGAPRKALAALFLGVEKRADLKRVPSLLSRLAPAGALWVVFPKGRTEVTERDVLGSGRDAGLKDIKVVRFSETHTALKFVRPRDQR
jgi:hypothetical protein